MELNEIQKQFIDKKLDMLSKSKFRSSFHLKKYMINYIDEKGFETLEQHAYDFVLKNLSSDYIPNDGKQTPMKAHPVFIAQHACACCCRGCLEKWHHIPKGRCLSDKEIRFIVALVLEWIKREYNSK